LSSPIVVFNLGVSNGLFITNLDFGSQFTGQATWLEIGVRSNNVGSFVVLAPRQQLTPTPNAVFATTASNLSGVASTAVNFSGSLSGDVTGTQTATVVSTLNGLDAAAVANGATEANAATFNNTGNTIVKRDGNGSFSASSVTLSTNLYLPTTTASSGIIYSGGAPFIHSYGANNFFAGSGAGNFTLSGNNNVGIGENALQANTSGSDNIAIGYNPLLENQDGSGNIAIGFNALNQFTSGQQNIAIGFNAGLFLTTGDYNIDIGNFGVSGDSSTMRIGTSGNQTSTFIAGISGVTVSSGSPVYINTTTGQLGTINSSQRFKRDIQNMGEASDLILALRPVTFRYKAELDPTSAPQFGLIAEEVNKVDPDLVLRDDKNQICTVRYEAINAMLLNEFLKEHKQVEAQNTVIQDLKRSVAELKAMVDKLAVK
jgi:hypothetical protein